MLSFGKLSLRCAIFGTKHVRSKWFLSRDEVESFRGSKVASRVEPYHMQPSSIEYHKEELLEIRRKLDGYVEFMPTSREEHRDTLVEHIERTEMVKRRSNMIIPTFYVGSVLAVTVADRGAPAKTTRFLGICIQRSGQGLRHNFTLRNVVDGLGVEIMYDMYNPCILRIELIKLEKRLDGHLLYLRDADLAHSSFPEDMKPVFLSPDSPVPLNTLKVALKPPPWTKHWEIYQLRGVTGLTKTEKMRKRAARNRKPWAEFDLMDQYRESTPLDEQVQIYQEILKLEQTFPPKGVVVHSRDVRRAR